MQHWTKNKPNKTGYYWIKFNENETYIAYISNAEQCYVTVNNEVYLINDKILNNVLWGNSCIPEPNGLKI